jgi:hypothetical protein
VNFKAEDTDPLARQFDNSTHVLWFGGGQKPPELWLNSAFDGLDAVLEDRGGRGGPEQRHHDLLRLSIARGVWMALLADAMAAIRTDDSEDTTAEPDWPAAEWQAEVLRLILPKILPGKSDRELLALAANEWRVHPGAAEFFARAEAVVGEMIHANAMLRRMIQMDQAEAMS